MSGEDSEATERGDIVASQWTRVGGELTGRRSLRPVMIEELIADTARVARDEASLYWIAASWLARHGSWVDLRRLRLALKALDPVSRAVAGSLLSVAAKESPIAIRLVAAAGHARALSPARPLFHIAESTPALATLVRAESLPLFTRWGLWQDDITLRYDAIRPTAAILENCPELRLRAALGPGLEAEIVAHTLSQPVSAKALREQLGATSLAIHAAAHALVHRGVLQAETQGRAHMLSPTAFGRELAGI
ncbi:MAG: hypothetical protein V4550_11645 [Gemmatimonadota bacterium]